MFWDHLHNRNFDAENLTAEVDQVTVNWMEGYGNDPNVVVHLKRLHSDLFVGALYEEFDLSHPGKKMYVADHPLGFVRYFCHSGREGPEFNEEGFGGAPFNVDVKGRGKICLYGPWSSRAACVNMIVPEEQKIADVSVRSNYLVSGAMKASALRHILPPEIFLIRGRSDRREQGPIVPSLAADRVLKPSGASSMSSYKQFEIIEP